MEPNQIVEIISHLHGIESSLLMIAVAAWIAVLFG
jgi:hypothetical protein